MNIEKGGWIARRPDSFVWGYCDLEEVIGYDPWRLKMKDELQGGQTILYEVTVTLKRLLGTIHEDWKGGDLRKDFNSPSFDGPMFHM